MAQWVARIGPFGFLLCANANILCWRFMRYESKQIVSKNYVITSRGKFFCFAPFFSNIFIWSQELLISHVVIPKTFFTHFNPRKVTNKILI
jgi:hypothetical protein